MLAHVLTPLLGQVLVTLAWLEVVFVYLTLKRERCETGWLDSVGSLPLGFGVLVWLM